LKEKVTGLTIALYLMTLTRAYFAAKLKMSIYKTTCSRAVEVLEYEPGMAAVQAWIRKVNQNGYGQGQEWFASVPERLLDFDPNVNANRDEEEEEEASEGLDGGLNGEQYEDEDDVLLSGKRRRKITKTASRTDEDDPDGVLLPGLHTMMQEAFDFLSEERTLEFEKWKKQLLSKLDRLDNVKSPAVKAGKAVAVK